MAEYTGRAGQLSMRRAIGIEPGHEP